MANPRPLASSGDQATERSDQVVVRLQRLARPASIHRSWLVLVRVEVAVGREAALGCWALDFEVSAIDFLATTLTVVLAQEQFPLRKKVAKDSISRA